MAKRTRAKDPQATMTKAKTPKVAKAKTPHHPQHQADRQSLTDLKKTADMAENLLGITRRYLGQRVKLLDSLVTYENTAEKIALRQKAIRTSWDLMTRLAACTAVPAHMRPPVPHSFGFGRAIVRFLKGVASIDEVLTAMSTLHDDHLRNALPEISEEALRWADPTVLFRLAVDVAQQARPGIDLRAVVSELVNHITEATPISEFDAMTKAVKDKDKDENKAASSSTSFEALTQLLPGILTALRAQQDLVDDPDGCEWDLGDDCDTQLVEAEIN